MGGGENSEETTVLLELEAGGGKEGGKCYVVCVCVCVYTCV